MIALEKQKKKEVEKTKTVLTSIFPKIFSDFLSGSKLVTDLYANFWTSLLDQIDNPWHLPYGFLGLGLLLYLMSYQIPIRKFKKAISYKP